MSSSIKLKKIIERCSVPQLNENIGDDHTTLYLEWRNLLNQEFAQVEKLLADIDFSDRSAEHYSLLSCIVIFFYELQSRGPWQGDQEELVLNISKKLDTSFSLLYEISLDRIFTTESSIIDRQKVFDECLRNLHNKISAIDYRKYPSLIEVYCKLLENLQNFNIIVYLATSLPIALFLIDDSLEENKLKGLKCCFSVLNCLTLSNFETYYEVVYNSLKKSVKEKNIEITKQSIQCLSQMLSVITDKAKISVADDIYADVLEQLLGEANVYRKAELLVFTKNLIKILGVHCVKRKAFKTVACLNIDECCVKTIGDIQLNNVLECIEEWIKYSWCVWRLRQDQQLLSVLLKCLYVYSDDEIKGKLIQIIATLIYISQKGERDLVIENLEKSSKIKSESFRENIAAIKKCLQGIVGIQFWLFMDLMLEPEAPEG